MSDELERKIEALSEKLNTIHETIFKLHESQVKIYGFITGEIEGRRKEEERTKKKFEIALYYWSLIMGLLLGVLANLFTSYFMEYLKSLGVSPFIFGITALSTFVGFILLIWAFYRKIRSLGIELKEI